MEKKSMHESMPESWAVSQPQLFDLGEVTSGAAELFPAVWSALEELISPDLPVRRSAINRLVELGAVRLSPLSAYVLSTRLVEPDLALRALVIQTLGAVLRKEKQGQMSLESVRRTVRSYLSQMRDRRIYGLLQACDAYPEISEDAASILNACPNAGSHLVAILENRKIPLPLRLQAVMMIGRVGYLDTLPNLERFESRLAIRLEGQQSFSTIYSSPPAVIEEEELLPAIRAAIRQLRGT